MRDREFVFAGDAVNGQEAWANLNDAEGPGDVDGEQRVVADAIASALFVDGLSMSNVFGRWRCGHGFWVKLMAREQAVVFVTPLQGLTLFGEHTQGAARDAHLPWAGELLHLWCA